MREMLLACKSNIKNYTRKELLSEMLQKLFSKILYFLKDISIFDLWRCRSVKNKELHKQVF